MLARSLTEPLSHLGPSLSTGPRANAQEQGEVADARPPVDRVSQSVCLSGTLSRLD